MVGEPSTHVSLAFVPETVREPRRMAATKADKETERLGTRSLSLSLRQTYCALSYKVESQSLHGDNTRAKEYRD